jgi:transposase InsO family protein
MSVKAGQAQEWLYLATVIDIASRRVVGWSTADHLRTDLIDQALTNAVTHRRPAAGVVFHSDRGCQGEFNWSSQHLDGEELRWGNGEGDGRV